MFRIRSIAMLLLVLLGLTEAVCAAGPDARIFVLTQTPDGLVIEAVPIAAGEVKVFRCNDADSGVIDLIFPPSAGQSAGLVTPGDGRTLIVRNTGDELRCQSRAPDGSTYDCPPRSLNDLARYDIRVNVTAGDARTAFLITCYDEASQDIGPVANMFAGRLPAAMLESGIVVQTETYVHDAGAPIVGTVPLEMDRWPFVRVTLPNGTTGDFIVDVGAATTVVDRSVLPDDLEIMKSSMMEYSASGVRTLKYAPGGATGAVENVLGHARLDHVTLGDVRVENVTPTVLEEMPDIFGRPVAGIIGLDILRRCDRLVLSLGPSPHGPAHLTFVTDVRNLSTDTIEAPFAYVSDHLVVEGACNGRPMFFILDSGAPSPFLDTGAAQMAGVEGDAAQAGDARGLDAGRLRTTPGMIEHLTIGGQTFEGLECRIGALAAFDNLRGPDQYIGLLGNSFFDLFDRMEIDFNERRVRFVAR